MASKKVATTIYITVEQDRHLKLLSQATKTSMAQYIREGIDLVLKEHQGQLPHQLGLGLSDEETR
jgi:predicted DNA-binding protein